ncbi:hypothetical protein ACIF8T_21510 [Streptomyces sp. NPDC085946]|uniref:hypothetical protein n=1 Tax=Streptomyces sp. NPDC085946 TaxID=3365744 RepID=UPI0037D35CC3
MARLQILELPEGAGDDRPPFILVVDQYEPPPYPTDVNEPGPFGGIAEKIGARAVLVFEETIDIPANDTTAYLGSSGMKTEIDLKLGDQDVREAIAADMQRMREANEDRILDSRQARIDAQRLADERTGIARDMDRLANHKDAITDALGIDRLQSWDDIRNAVAGLRKERDAQAAAAQRVRDLHRPVEHRGQTICWACSDYDFPGQTTDSPPVAYDQCLTLKALAGYPAPDA